MSGGPLYSLAGPLIFATDGMGQFQAQAQGPLRKMVEEGQITQGQMDDRMAVGGGKAAAVSAFTYYLIFPTKNGRASVRCQFCFASNASGLT